MRRSLKIIPKRSRKLRIISKGTPRIKRKAYFYHIRPKIRRRRRKSSRPESMDFDYEN